MSSYGLRMIRQMRRLVNLFLIAATLSVPARIVGGELGSGLSWFCIAMCLAALLGELTVFDGVESMLVCGYAVGLALFTMILF